MVQSIGNFRYRLAAMALLAASFLFVGVANAALIRGGTSNRPPIQDGGGGHVIAETSSILGSGPYAPGSMQEAAFGSLIHLSPLAGDWIIPYDPVDCLCLYEFPVDGQIHFDKHMPSVSSSSYHTRTLEWIITGDGQTWTYSIDASGFINVPVPSGVVTEPPYGDGLLHGPPGTTPGCCAPVDSIYKAFVRATYTTNAGYVLGFVDGPGQDTDPFRYIGAAKVVEGPSVFVRFTAVPEPAAIVLLFAGLLMMGVRRRGRRGN